MNYIPTTKLPYSYDSTMHSRDLHPTNLIAVAVEGASHSCIMQGNSHIKTFDGKRYQFNGPCTYALVLDNQMLAFAVYVEVVVSFNIT